MKCGGKSDLVLPAAAAVQKWPQLQKHNGTLGNTLYFVCVCVCVHIFGHASTCPSPAGSGDVARVKHLLAAVNTEQRLTSFTLFDGSKQLSSVQAKSHRKENFSS